MLVKQVDWLIENKTKRKKTNWPTDQPTKYKWQERKTILWTKSNKPGWLLNWKLLAANFKTCTEEKNHYHQRPMSILCVDDGYVKKSIIIIIKVWTHYMSNNEESEEKCPNGMMILMMMMMMDKKNENEWCSHFCVMCNGQPNIVFSFSF